MLKSYFKTALRGFRRNKVHFILNAAGLSVGMSVAMLIGLYIWDELSFDKYHDNYARIAQVKELNTLNGIKEVGTSTSQPVATTLQKNYSADFKHVVLAFWMEPHVLAVGDNQVSFHGNYMSADAPEMLSLKMEMGTRAGLEDPSSILISSTVSEALFHGAEPIGQTIKLDNAGSLKVAGVYDPLPRNTTLHDLDFIAPWEYFMDSHGWVRNSRNNWRENSFQLFVELAPNADTQTVSSKIADIKLNNLGSEGAQSKPRLFLQPMRKWHLYNEFKNGVNTGGAIQYVWMFGIIGVFVLLLACINFMNLSTARSEKRAKEVGIRKTIGSPRIQLIYRFFFESILLAFIAFCLALLFVILALPFFNTLSNKSMALPWASPVFWIICITFTLFTGTIAGLYPALYLSSFNPVKVLKGTFKAGRSAAVPRRILVTIQFVVSITLIIGTIIVFKQIKFAKDRPIGYNRAGLVNLNVSTHNLEGRFEAFNSALLGSGVVTAIAETSSPMTQIHNFSRDISWKEKDPRVEYDFASIHVTSTYGKTTNWQVLEGRDFSSEFATDSAAVILNEAAVKYMGLSKPIGEIIRVNDIDHVVIGVVKDMVMQSPYDPAEQTLFSLAPGDFDHVVLRINPAKSAHDAVSRISSIYKQYDPAMPMDYQFVDEAYTNKFADEERVGKLAGVFAALTIFISCLGLFGMASFMAEQRTRELGVRKVLGASILDLWGLLSAEFIGLVVIASVIAMPTAYYFMHNWLQRSEYRTGVPWWIFTLTGAGALLITLVTISFQSLKAAITSPVKSLRSE
jgi:putative ABC transport system permease protein